MTYDERLQAFLKRIPDRADGFVTWYGATGSYIQEFEHYLTGATLRSLVLEGCTLPNRLTFTGQDLAEYFLAGEDLPCFMRGSLYSLRTKSAWAQRVFERQINRWLRKSKITCLDRNEWEGIVYQDFWRSRMRRLGERYGMGRFDGMTWLFNLVTAGTPAAEEWSESQVLVNGKSIYVDKERLAALREMHALERKLRKAA